MEQHAHSLGTCVVAVAAKFLRLWGIVLAAMLLLDPVAWGYDFANPLISPRKDDVKYLQVAHLSRLGILLPFGHADIYFKGAGNGKQDQCPDSTLLYIPVPICEPFHLAKYANRMNIIVFLSVDLSVTDLCSHNRSFTFYDETILGYFIGKRPTGELRPYLAWKCELSPLIMEDKCVNVTVDGKKVLGMAMGIIPEENQVTIPDDKDYIIHHKPEGVLYMETKPGRPHAKEDPFETNYLGSSMHTPFKFEREALTEAKYKKLMAEIGMGVKDVLVDVTEGQDDPDWEL